MLTLNDGRKELYQWDTGRTATVDIECDVVHFSNLKYGESLAVEVKSGKVVIPNKLLMSGEQIYCWAFVQDESGAYTKKEQILAVTKRAKPSDYVYTETEVITIKTAVENALEEAKESGDFKGEKGEKGDKGGRGDDGYTPQKGVDYFTPEDIAELNIPSVDQTYTPTSENAQSGKAVNEAVEPKLDKPSMPPIVGNVLKVLSLNEDGTFTCEWADAPSGGVVDVQIPYKNNVFPPSSPEYSEISIIDDNGIAHIPRLGIKNAGVGKYGLIAVDPGQNTGLIFDSESRWDTGSPGCLKVYCATESIIKNRYISYHWGHISIPVAKFDYAVKAAMCDGKGTAWTDTERIAALLRMGCTVDDNGFVKWTAQEVSE